MEKVNINNEVNPNNKIKIKDTNEISTAKETVIVKNVEPKKISIKNKFMTHQERENSLAELIMDMELYHLNSFKN